MMLYRMARKEPCAEALAAAWGKGSPPAHALPGHRQQEELNWARGL
jgi:hypothetical protein